MANKIHIFAVVFLVTVIFQNVAAEQKITQEIQPRLLIVEIAKLQIRAFISIVKHTVEAQIKILNDMRLTVKNIAIKTVRTAINVINGIIDATIGTARDIMQDAIDKGINITECYILNMDKLNVLRRQLIVAEIQCATSQVGEFYEIIDEAIHHFTDNLLTALSFPARLQKCLINPLTVIKCVAGVIEDVTQLQKNIPKQILDTMFDIIQYFNEFDQRVHRCQFDQIRKAVASTRLIVDNLFECTRHPENGADFTISAITN